MLIAQFGDNLIAGPLANLPVLCRPAGWRELCFGMSNKFFDCLASSENLSPC